MSTLELFEFPDLKGESVSIKHDIPDLTTVGFLKKAQSLKIHGDPWIVFSDTCYKGKFQCFLEGSYPSIPAFEKKISSVRVVRGGLQNPQITLFELINFGGKSLTLNKPAFTLKFFGFENMASSQKDVRGAWILYSEEYYKGDQMVTVTGDDIFNYKDFGWADKVSSLKPLQPYGDNDAPE